jgi:hypothetical protein
VITVGDVRVIAWRDGVPCWVKDWSPSVARLLLGKCEFVRALMDRTGCDRLQVVDAEELVVDLRDLRAEPRGRPADLAEANRRRFRDFLAGGESESGEGRFYRGGGDDG